MYEEEKTNLAGYQVKKPTFLSHLSLSSQFMYAEFCFDYFTEFYSPTVNNCL